MIGRTMRPNRGYIEEEVVDGVDIVRYRPMTSSKRRVPPGARRTSSPTPPRGSQSSLGTCILATLIVCLVNVSGWGPSAAGTGAGSGGTRRLNMEKRMAEVANAAGEECNRRSYVPEDCSSFIDSALSDLLDRHWGESSSADAENEKIDVATRSLVDRDSKDHPWHDVRKKRNVVVITMDDNDLVLGKGFDGLVYYENGPDGKWKGSGQAASNPAQRLIPPIEWSETQSGAYEGSRVVTEYVPSRRGDWPDSSNDPFDYTRDPLEQKGLLERRGGTVNEAILGIQRPINGGIVLYRDARNSPEGQSRLDGVLNGPQSAVEEKGDRNIGPFDCRGLTGFGCCLLVKHSVVDADVDGRAIQCWLEYHPSTCKDKWMRDHGRDVGGSPSKAGSGGVVPALEAGAASCGAVWGRQRFWSDYDGGVSSKTSDAVLTPTMTSGV